MDILVYITGFTAIVAVICLVMLMNLRSAVAPAEGGSTSAAAAAPGPPEKAPPRPRVRQLRQQLRLQLLHRQLTMAQLLQLLLQRSPAWKAAKSLPFALLRRTLGGLLRHASRVRSRTSDFLIRNINLRRKDNEKIYCNSQWRSLQCRS